jgi:uncharacterized protein (DUF58 family)
MLLGVAGVTAGNNLLFVLLGASLGLIVLSGVLSERAVTPVRVRIRALDRLRAGETGRFVIAFERTGSDRSPVFGLTVQERNGDLWQMLRRRVSPGHLQARLPALIRERAELVTERQLERRGRLELGSCELSTTFPFGLLHKVRDVDLVGDAWVRPRRVPLPPALSAQTRGRLGEATQPRQGEGVEFFGVRERREDEVVRRLHALRTAALGRDVVVETAHEGRPTAWLGVVHDAGVDPEALERALELAASWAEDRDARGFEVGHVSGEKISIGIDEVLDDLARMERDGAGKTASGADVLWFVPEGGAPPREGMWVRVDRAGGWQISSGQPQ